MDYARILYSEISFKPAKTNSASATNGHHPGPKNGELTNLTSTTTTGTSDEFQLPRHQLCDPNLVKLDWLQAEKVGGGLINVGNTCFLNSVLQCLTYCPPLYNFLVKLNGGHSNSCKINQFCMLCEMERHVKRIKNSNGSSIKPISIVQRLKYINKSFQFGRQEDAHEFLRYIIDHMWKACLMNLDINSKMGKIDPRIKETTVINHIFGGYHRSQVLCLTCNSRSNTFDFFMDFILDIRNAKSLEDALKKFTQSETLENENAYKCGKCRKKVTARKKFTVYKAPNVATFQLKRFDSDRIFGGKVTKFISYPEELDLRPYMSEPSCAPIKYQLSAVLVHLGHSSNSGHYFCFIKNSNNFWYRMDDSNVSLVTQNSVLQQQAYVLFYTKKQVNDQELPSNGLARDLKCNSLTPSTANNSTTHSIKNTKTCTTPNSSPTAPDKDKVKLLSRTNGSHKITNYFSPTARSISQIKNLKTHDPSMNTNGSSIPGENECTANGVSDHQNHNNPPGTKNQKLQAPFDAGKAVFKSAANPDENFHETGARSNADASKNAPPLATSFSTWQGSRSQLDEVKSNEKSDRDMFNEELDQGKTKKIKSRSRDDRFSNLSKSNPFQRFTSNGYQQYGKRDCYSFQKHNGRQYNGFSSSNSFSPHCQLKSKNFRRQHHEPHYNKFRPNGKHRGRNFGRRQ